MGGWGKERGKMCERAGERKVGNVREGQVKERGKCEGGLGK